jgi:non-heme chloroperoxidase
MRGGPQFIHGLWLLPSKIVGHSLAIPNRGHSLTIDSGWREVADRALAFVKRFV